MKCKRHNYKPFKDGIKCDDCTSYLKPIKPSKEKTKWLQSYAAIREFNKR